MKIEEILAKLEEKGQSLTTAESCTGGGLAARITSRPGASAVFRYGFVVYSNEAKETLLGVGNKTLATHGAVSAETAGEMALGAAKLAEAEFAIAVTGIAGPAGGSVDKPVGLVYFGFLSPKGLSVEKCVFSGDRGEIRAAAVAFALDLIAEGVRGKR